MESPVTSGVYRDKLQTKESVMADLSNKAEELGGKAKEAAGEAVGNDDLKNEGKGDQVKSEVKQGVEDLKDKATEALGKLKGEE